MGRSARLSLTLLAICVLMTVRVSSTKAQRPDWAAADGNYIGSMTMSGTYGMSPAAFGAQGVSGEILWTGVGAGPLEINIAGGAGTGTWEINGAANIGGTVTGGNTSFEFEGAQIWGAKGDLIGEFTGFVAVPLDELVDAIQDGLVQTISLTGESFATAEVTVSDPVNSQTRTDSYSEPADLILYYQTVSCTQIQGGWIEPAEAELAAAGFRPDLEGYWSVVRQDTISEEVQDQLREEIARLLQQSANLKAQIDQCQFPDPAVFENYLRDIYNLLNSIEKDQSCGISPNELQYVYPVTYAACSTMSSWAHSSSRSGRDCAEDLSPSGSPTLPYQSGLLAYSAASLGCSGQDFYTKSGIEAAAERNLLDAIQNLDLSTVSDLAQLLQMMDVASTMGLDSVVDAGKEAWRNRQSGGGE